jgi:hypothetical protein
LRELGNSGTPSEVNRSISEKENLSDDELNKRLKNRTEYTGSFSVQTL